MDELTDFSIMDQIVVDLVAVKQRLANLFQQVANFLLLGQRELLVFLGGATA